MGASRGWGDLRGRSSFEDGGVGFVDCGCLFLKHGVEATEVSGFPAAHGLVAFNALLEDFNVAEHFLGARDRDSDLVQPLILAMQDLEAE